MKKKRYRREVFVIFVMLCSGFLSATASAVILMVKSLGLKVIAKGVEGQGQTDFLKQHDCDILQGYHFSRPVPALSFEELLKKQQHF